MRSVAFIYKKLVTTDRFVNSRQRLDSRRRLYAPAAWNLIFAGY